MVILTQLRFDTFYLDTLHESHLFLKFLKSVLEFLVHFLDLLVLVVDNGVLLVDFIPELFDLFLFQPGMVLDLIDFNFVSFDVVDQLVNIVERHSLLNLLNDLSQRHLRPLQVDFPLVCVLFVLNLLPFGLLGGADISKDIFKSLWAVFFDDLKDAL